MVSASEEAGARCSHHPSGCRSVLHALSDAQLSVRCAVRGDAGCGPAAAGRGGAPSRRSPRPGAASRASGRRASRPARGLGEGGARAGERLDDRLRLGGALPGRHPRRDDDGGERVPAGPPVRRVQPARQLLRLAAFERSGTRAGRRAGREARQTGGHGHRHRRRRCVLLRRAALLPLRAARGPGADPQPSSSTTSNGRP